MLSLSNATLSSLFPPHLLVADVGVWSTFLLGVSLKHVICVFYLFFLPVRLPSEIQKLPQALPVRGFPGVRKLPLLLLPSQDGSPFLALLPLFIFYISYYLLSKTMGCFSEHLMSSASSQKLFSEVCTAFKCSFNEFVGEKVVFLSYSSSILAPLLRCIPRGLRQARTKPLKYGKLANIEEEEKEAPGKFLDRLREAVHRFLEIDPESEERKVILMSRFLTQLAPDISISYLNRHMDQIGL